MRRTMWTAGVVMGLVGCQAGSGADPGADAPAADPGVAPAAAYERGRVLLAAGSDAPGVGVSLRSWGLDGDLRDVEAVEPTRADGRTEYRTPGLVEWWQPVLQGLEQGFTLDGPLGGEELVLDLVLEGAVAEVDADERSATWWTDRGTTLRYEGLVAWDERGVALPSRMEPTGDGLRLVVDVSAAEGDVTVDPVFPGASWAVVHPTHQSMGLFGAAVALAGDVNGDGFDEVLVGASDHDGGVTDQGMATLYLGSAAGPGAAPAWTATSGQAGAQLGASVASAGDVNGDGYGDVLVGASAWDGALTDQGAAFLYLGSAGGLGAAPAWTATVPQASASFGASVASAGDVNGDGFDDVVVSASAYDDGHTDEGAAFLYLGSARGLRASPAWSAQGGQASAFFGGSVASAGDVNGDGYDDVIVGAMGFTSAPQVLYEGAAFLYLGSAAGLQAAPAWTARSNQAYALFGFPVASAGDVNGDGRDDVIVGASDWNAGRWGHEGAAAVYLGAAGGLEPAPAWWAEGTQSRAGFGAAAAGVGDVNGDGFDDVAVGAGAFTRPGGHEGLGLVYLGSATGPSARPSAPLISQQPDAYLGSALGGGGDVNGDGLDDLVLGAPRFNGAALNEGAAVLYYGR